MIHHTNNKTVNIKCKTVGLNFCPFSLVLGRAITIINVIVRAAPGNKGKKEIGYVGKNVVGSKGNIS